MDIKLIKELVEILENSNSLMDMEVKEDEFEIKLSKKGPDQIIHQNMAMPANNVAVPNISAPQVSEQNVVEQSGVTLKAPLVGTYYGRPAPDKDAFVNVGDSVKKGDVICIIEAMKVMNEIKAETAGKVKKVLVNDGDLVEFDQALFELE